jgi:hypothetical protein
MATQFEELEATTKQEIHPAVVEDLFFLGSPLLAYFKGNIVDFAGGAWMQNIWNFRPKYGGSYALGDTFTTQRTPTVTAGKARPKYYYSAVPEFKELLQVENVGPNAVVSILNVDMANSIQSLNAFLAIAMWQQGQSGARVTDINGFAEQFNDGISESWDGAKYTSYLGETRNGDVGSGLNSIPLFVGDSEGGLGAITHPILTESYQDASIGEDEPNLGIGNKAVYAYIIERMQPQQRFVENLETDPIYGATGFRFMKARILKDEYCPSLVYGVNDPIVGSFLTSTFAATAGTDSRSKLPASGKTVNVGETFWWINTRVILPRMSIDPEYAFGWSGFLPSQFDTRVVGYNKVAFNLQNLSPRLGKQVYGIGS